MKDTQSTRTNWTAAAIARHAILIHTVALIIETYSEDHGQFNKFW